MAAKRALPLFNADVPPSPADNNAVKVAGDGWLQRQGYTPIWFGWQADVRWTRKIGQEVKLGLLLRRMDLNDGQTEAVFGGFQGEGCS